MAWSGAVYRWLPNIGLLTAAFAVIVGAAGIAGAAAGRSRSGFPKLGTCFIMKVSRISDRFGDPIAAGSGSRIVLADGIVQVSYDRIPQLMRSRARDGVTACVVELPHHCPPGDNRGVYYRTRNWRTHASWTLPDSQHSCGGA